MNGHLCCEGARSPSRRLIRRFFEAAGYVLPGVMVALLPKCPMCLAAWLALATGVGLSLPAAGILRTLLLILSLAPLLFLAARARSRAWLRLRKGIERLVVGCLRSTGSRAAISEPRVG